MSDPSATPDPDIDGGDSIPRGITPRDIIPRDIPDVAGAGAPVPLEQEFEVCRPRLRRMIELRLDPRLQGRIDPSDVLQESFLVAMKRYAEFDPEGSVPLFVWIRFLALQELQQHHRYHLTLQKRDVRREQRLAATLDPSTPLTAHALLAHTSSPSERAIESERRERLVTALDALCVEDREILALRYYEHLSNNEVAAVLGLPSKTASSRYVRALARLGRQLNPPQEGSAR